MLRITELRVIWGEFLELRKVGQGGLLETLWCKPKWGLLWGEQRRTGFGLAEHKQIKRKMKTSSEGSSVLSTLPQLGSSLGLLLVLLG